MVDDIISVRYGGRTIHFKPMPESMQFLTDPALSNPTITYLPATAESYDGSKVPIFLADELAMCPPPPDQSPPVNIIEEVAKYQEAISKCWMKINSVIVRANIQRYCTTCGAWSSVFLEGEGQERCQNCNNLIVEF